MRRGGKFVAAVTGMLVLVAMVLAGTPMVSGAAVPSAKATTTHGYWLVGGDGGIFSFGDAGFYGSTGSLHLQRPIVGITPTPDHRGYWLVASDGGVFAFGDASYVGSIPGLGIAPAGSTGPGPSLDAPIVGMVPSASGNGYFLVASDGGVFAFGDATYEGSCPGSGGCNAPAVTVLPNKAGTGYLLVTTVGSLYGFGENPVGCVAFLPSPPNLPFEPVTSAAATPDGGGCWILTASGSVSNGGDATLYHGPRQVQANGATDPATSIFSDSTAGYWVATANGTVYSFGDAPFEGDMSSTSLNAPIIAATGW